MSELPGLSCIDIAVPNTLTPQTLNYGWKQSNLKRFSFYNRNKTRDVYMSLLFVQIPYAGDAQRETVSCSRSSQ